MSDRERIVAALESVADIVVTNMCCGSCSTAGLPEGTVAYFHAQDIERAFAIPGESVPVGEMPTPGWGGYDEDGDSDEDEPEEPDYDLAVNLVGDLYIGYGIDDLDNEVQTERATTKHRKALVAALVAAGFDAEDPGDNASRILIRA